MVRLGRCLSIACAVCALTAPAAGADGWSAPVRAPYSVDLDALDLTLGVNPVGTPTASWDQPGPRAGRAVEWTRLNRSRWSAPIRVPGDRVGGLYAQRHEWTIRVGDRRAIARRGVPGRPFRPPEPVAPRARRFWAFQADRRSTAPNGASLVALTRADRRGRNGHLYVAIRRPGHPFMAPRLVGRSPVLFDAFDAKINARGEGVLAWASPRWLLAVRIRGRRLGPVRRLAALEREPVSSVSTDVASDGSGLVAWLESGSHRPLGVVRLGPTRGVDLPVIARVRRRYGVDYAGAVLALARPGGGLVVWPGSQTRLWSMSLDENGAGRRRRLSPRPAYDAEWITGATSAHGVIGVLWSESTDAGGTRLYAGERGPQGWLHRRQLVSHASTVEQNEADLAFDPCTGRPLATWLALQGDHARLLSATGPKVDHRGRGCRPR